MPTTLFTNIANAIRSRFGISGTITPLQFGNKINPSTPVLSTNSYISFDVAMAMILENTADAIRARGGTSAKIAPNDMPTAIQDIKILQYGDLTTISQNNVTWTSKPSMPTVSTSKTSYTLSWEYYWIHSSYDRYKVNSVTITPNSNSVYNPAFSSNIKNRPYGGDISSSLVLRCSYSKTVNFSGLISNMQGAPESEIVAEMESELRSEMSSVNDLGGNFSFSISYYAGTYV
jgi:hypothetical protein